MKILLGKIMYEHNLSIRQVALHTGLSSSTIHKVMREDSNPNDNTPIIKNITVITIVGIGNKNFNILFFICSFLYTNIFQI